MLWVNQFTQNFAKYIYISFQSFQLVQCHCSLVILCYYRKFSVYENEKAFLSSILVTALLKIILSCQNCSTKNINFSLYSNKLCSLDKLDFYNFLFALIRKSVFGIILSLFPLITIAITFNFLIFDRVKVSLRF